MSASTVPGPAAGTSRTDVPALEVDDLRLSFRVRGHDREAIRGVTFHVAKGESYGLVGESGCGKSTIAFTAMRYMARNARITAGTIPSDGRGVMSTVDHE